MSKVINVSSSTPVPQLASSITHVISEDKDVSLRAIGAGAVSQAIKGVIVARGLLAAKGFDILIRPGFDTVADKTEAREITVVVLNLVIR